MNAFTSAAEGISRLAVLAKLPGKVTEKFAGKRTEFVVIFFDEEGGISDMVREETNPVSIRGRDLAFAAGAVLKPGNYSCRLVIRDMDTGMSAVASAKATVVKPQITGLELGTPLVLEMKTGCSLLSARPKKAGAVVPWADIYPFDSSLFSPVLADLPSTATSLQVVMPCAFPGGGRAELAMSANLINAASGERSPLTISRMDRVQKGPSRSLPSSSPRRISRQARTISISTPRTGRPAPSATRSRPLSLPVTRSCAPPGLGASCVELPYKTGGLPLM